MSAPYVDDTPFGRGGDHCPWCAADWKAPHYPDCPEGHVCEYPPGCERQAMRGMRLCSPHYEDVRALFGEPRDA